MHIARGGLAQDTWRSLCKKWGLQDYFPTLANWEFCDGTLMFRGRRLRQRGQARARRLPWPGLLFWCMAVAVLVPAVCPFKVSVLVELLYICSTHTNKYLLEAPASGPYRGACWCYILQTRMLAL